MIKKLFILILAALMVVMAAAGCSSQNTANSNNTTNANTETSINETATAGTESSANAETDAAEAEETSSLPNVEVQFSMGGEKFILKPYDNSTARELIRNIGDYSRDIVLDDEGGALKYSDILSGVSIPSNSETITSAKVGEVYYSDPNRIILVYKDTKLTGEYTKVGYIENKENLTDAVENMPLISDTWKVVSVNIAK